MYTRFGFNFYDIFIAIFCIGFGIICFYPLWYCVVASVMPYEEYVKGGMMLWFKGFDLQYYIQIFGTRAYVNSLWISVAKTVLGTVLSLLVTSTMAYAVSKSHIKGMKFINLLVVFNLFFAGGLIPTYMLYRDLNLIGRFLVMVIPGALNITYFIIMRNYFSFSVPKELEEAALLDGCSEFTSFFRVVMPLSRSMMAAVGLGWYKDTAQAVEETVKLAEQATVPVPDHTALYEENRWRFRGLYEGTKGLLNAR